MNTHYSFLIQVYGIIDGKTYTLDQYADSDGMFRFHILARSGPYAYHAYRYIYSGNQFIVKKMTNKLLLMISLKMLELIGEIYESSTCCDWTCKLELQLQAY